MSLEVHLAQPQIRGLLKALPECCPIGLSCHQAHATWVRTEEADLPKGAPSPEQAKSMLR